MIFSHCSLTNSAHLLRRMLLLLHNLCYVFGTIRFVWISELKQTTFVHSTIGVKCFTTSNHTTSNVCSILLAKSTSLSRKNIFGEISIEWQSQVLVLTNRLILVTSASMSEGKKPKMPSSSSPFCGSPDVTS